MPERHRQSHPAGHAAENVDMGIGVGRSDCVSVVAVSSVVEVIAIVSGAFIDSGNKDVVATTAIGNVGIVAAYNDVLSGARSFALPVGQLVDCCLQRQIRLIRFHVRDFRTDRC